MSFSVIPKATVCGDTNRTFLRRQGNAAAVTELEAYLASDESFRFRIKKLMQVLVTMTLR